MGFRDSLSGGVRLVRAVPSPIGFCQFGAVQLHPEAGCSGRRRERRSVCLWRRRRAPRRPALADGRQCRPRHERCVGSLREDSGRKLIFYPHRMGSALQLPVGMRIFKPRGSNRGPDRAKRRRPPHGRRASEGAGVVSGRPETPGGTRRAGPLRRCGSSRPHGWIRAGSGRSASRRRARRSCPWRRRRGGRRRARRARASRRASSCRARRRTFRRT